VVQLAPAGAAASLLAVIFEVVGVASHRDLDAALRQQLVARTELLREAVVLGALIERRGIVAAGKTRMAHNRDDELATAAPEGALEPGLLPFVHRAQDAGINRDQREILCL
jgi:hypothetical protein